MLYKSNQSLEHDMFKMLHALLIVYYLSFLFQGEILQAAGATPTKVLRTPVEPQSPLSPGRVLHELGKIQQTPARTNPKAYAREQIDTADSKFGAAAARYRRHLRTYMSSESLSEANIEEEDIATYLEKLHQLEKNRDIGYQDEHDAITAFQLTSNNTGNTNTYYEIIDGKSIGTRPDAISDQVMLEIKSKRGKKPVLYRTRQLRAQEAACKRQGLTHKIVITSKEEHPKKFPSISKNFNNSSSQIRLITKNGFVYRRSLDRWIKVKS